MMLGLILLLNLLLQHWKQEIQGYNHCFNIESENYEEHWRTLEVPAQNFETENFEGFLIIVNKEIVQTTAHLSS